MPDNTADQIFKEDYVIKDEMTLSGNVVFAKNLIIEKGGKLILNNGTKVTAENINVSGEIFSAADGFGFKPGTVVGRQQLRGTSELKASGSLIIRGNMGGEGLIVKAADAVIETDCELSGMFIPDHTEVCPEITLTMKDGAWLSTEVLSIGHDAVLNLSETEITVLNYARNPEYKGFYAHTSYGKTILEENVSVISDDSFVWLLMGKTNRPFAKVSGQAVLKTAEYMQTDEEDMNNIMICTVNPSDAGCVIQYCEKNPHYRYHGSKALAADAVLYNEVMKQYPGAVVFGFYGKYYCYRNDQFRAANILIHTAGDLQTFADFAQAVAVTKETEGNGHE